MNIKMQGRFALLAVLGSASIANIAQAQNAYLFIAHAVPGRNISSTTNPEFPVDFSANGVCVAKGINFGDIRGPLTETAGTTTAQFTIANSASPCQGAPVFSATITLSAGISYFGVLTLDAGGGLTGQIYTADLSPITDPRIGRFLVINAAQEFLIAAFGVDNIVNSAGVSPGTILDATAPGGLYTASIYAAPNTAAIVGPVSVQVEQRNVYVYVLAGTTSNQSVQLLGPKAIRGVF
jgi:hypothetical protein